ncbi:hypothetical protein DL89DRAFT_286877 [Linderina pennispora]|uniref:Malonyl-CoA:ACP transacylase (MAT) domain-containing protein n=1 Tax=Linderina pennispora TaxID=61395 RepID=A0A1Y1VWP4_9FUNG|nr:uncharacterized protein DL89DRAFT_286877 [Linderina pennispora]ORX65702.1 hypothetical protein DL89DRAFT_286877 [Linderina pennispora]
MDLFTCMVALASGGVSTNIPIPGDNFRVAKELATCFLDDSPPTVSTEIELIALFLAYCNHRNPDVSIAVFLHLHQRFCADKNIHVVVQQLNLSAEQVRTVLKGYYSVWDTLEARQLVPNVPIPAIFSDANFRLAAMFGGQSGADNCLDEAAWLLDIYGPLLSDFVTYMSEFLKRESANPLLAKAHSRPLDIAGWLASPDTMPDAKYLVMAPVAIPVLGLIQAMHVAVLYKTLNMSPGDLVSRFSVVIGHSQGLPMAAAFASVTDEVSFYAAAEKTLGILLTMPAILYVDFSSNASHTGIIELPLCSGELSTPMISVRGLDKETLESFITVFNADRTDEMSKVSLALVNGRSFFIVSGYPNAISLFGRYITKHTVLPTVDQSRVRFSLRKPVAVVTPLSISEPYHCDLQLENASKVYEFVTAKGWVLNADALRIQVNGGDDGHDLRDEVNITRFLVDSMVCALFNNADAAYTIDFSPGNSAFLGNAPGTFWMVTEKAVISTSALISDTQSRMGSKADLFKQNISDVFSAPNWQSAFGPRLVQTAHEGQLHIRTRMSLTLGLPPVMVAGMTPTMSNEHFVAAISNAGYHVELAGSGIYTEVGFRERVENLANLVEPGSGFAVNTVYMNKKQWAFQYPSILRMRREGVPITGLCIGASVPSVDVANSIIAELRDAGIRHVAFKPSGLAVVVVVTIHVKTSTSQFWKPTARSGLLPNTILVVGGVSSLDHAPMPVDGVLLESCVLAAKESGRPWKQRSSLQQPLALNTVSGGHYVLAMSGGVITIMSDFGEHVHLLATRAALALRELNDMIFSKPLASQMPMIIANKDHIIKRLNEDFTRPWFGKKSDGRVVDLEEMTYLEVLNRLVELMYNADKSRWLDVSYGRLFGEFILRMEDRVSGSDLARAFQWTSQLLDPIEVVHLLDETYPEISRILIALEDVQYLVWLCKRSGTKPVPFVPILDADLHVWMMKDIYSHHEDLDSVVDRDVQRTIIALDSVSAKYATTVNEPVKDILDRRESNKDASPICTVEYLAPEPSPVSLPSPVAVAVERSSRTYRLPTDAALLPNPDVWLEALAGPTQSWLRALLTSPVVVRKSLCAANPIRQVLRPMAGQTAEVSSDGDRPVKLDIHGPAGLLDIRIQFDGEKNILMIIYHRVGEEQFEIRFPYIYTPSKPGLLVAEDIEGRDLSYRNAYLRAHGHAVGSGDINSVGIEQHFSADALKSFTISQELVQKYCSSTHITSKGLLGIIHLSHSTKYVADASLLHVGETIDYQVSLTALENIESGQKTTLTSRFYRNGNLIAIAEDVFVIRGNMQHTTKCSDQWMNLCDACKSNQMRMLQRLVLKSGLYSKIAPSLSALCVEMFWSSGSIRTTSSNPMGSIPKSKQPDLCIACYPSREYEHIADVYYENNDAYDNYVIQFLNENQLSDASTAHFEYDSTLVSHKGNSGGLSFKAPSVNWEFAHASGDQKCGHQPHLALLLSRVVADSDPRRMRSYSVQFVGKVYPDDKLRVELVHAGMNNGYMVIDGKTVNQNGETVLTLTAEVAQAKTAYVFTGQGSQFVGMGMDLYMSSTAARDVWDRADRHMLKNYGVSLLKIVQENPREYLVKFGGKKGTPIRTHYLSLVREYDGKIEQLIPGITRSSKSYTHRCSNGLLNATLFTQPIQTVMSLAQAADMRAHGLIQDDAIFAGHSLGEFGSLAAIADIVSVEDAVDIALYRGLLLHASVDRDTNGAPTSCTCSELLTVFVSGKQQLLEVINYNVRGQQYVVTGHVESLNDMCLIAHEISKRSLSSAELEEGNILQDIIDGILSATPDMQLQEDGRITTRIPGVDVPSHSSQLLTSVDTFRSLLDQRIPHVRRLHTSLCGRYIPNLSGQPFEITENYFRHIHAITRSPVIEDVINCWSAVSHNSTSTRISLARTLLIELLSFQFASTVKWIDTQDTIFRICSVKRLVEIGPSPILCRMASQTLETENWLYGEVAILHARRDKDDTTNGIPNIPEKLSSPEIPALEEQPSPLPITPTTISTDNDVPIPTIDILRTIVSHKLAKSVFEINPGMSIKGLVAGKSIIQNELVGALQKEFSKRMPDYAEELSLEELAIKLGSTMDSLGKYSQLLVINLLTSKFPSRFTLSAARSYLMDKYGLGPRRQEAVLSLSATMEPSSRLADEDAAKIWLDSAVQVYARHVGLPLTATAKNSDNNGMSAGSIVINSAEFDRAQRNQKNLILEQVETLARHAGLDIRQGARSAEKYQVKLATLESDLDEIKQEVGCTFIERTKMMFDANKVRHYDSYWNWARQDAFEWISGILSGEEPSMDRGTYMKRIHMLKNRSNPGLLLMLQALISTLQTADSLLAHRALEQAETIYAECKESENSAPVYKGLSTPMRPYAEVTSRGDIVGSEIPREDEHSIYDYVQNMKRTSNDGLPLLHMYERQTGNTWPYSKANSEEYFKSMEEAAINGISFGGKCALVTGCGMGSIGSGLVEGLLSGGAKVITTMSNSSLESVRFFEEMYRKFGSRGSQLVLVPFNQASSCDVEALIQYIYDSDGLGWDLDYIAPFAVFPECGKDAENIDSYSELTIRTLLTNLLRMIGPD